LRLLTCFSAAIYKYKEEIHSSKISKEITISELIYYCEQFVIRIRLSLQKPVHSFAWPDSSFGRVVCYSLSHLAFVMESVQLMGMYGSECCWHTIVQLMIFTTVFHSPLVPPFRSPAFRSGGTCLRKQSSRKFAIDLYRCRITPFKLWLSSGYTYRRRIQLWNANRNTTRMNVFSLGQCFQNLLHSEPLSLIS